MNSRSLSLIAIGLISLIILFSFILYEMGSMKLSIPSGAPWQRPIENFATALGGADGKVFMTDNKGSVFCFDSQNGESIWNSSVGGSGAHRITISGSQVYVASEDAKISCFDKDNGTLLWTFQNADFFEWLPSIIVKDGLIFARTDAISAHDAITGELLWEANPILEHFNASQSRAFPLESDLVDGKFVYAIGGDISKMSFYKIDAENGNVIWRSNVTWDGTVLTWGAGNIYVPRVVARSQEQIVIEVIFQGTSEVNHFLCLDSSSGEKLWSIDVGADDGYNPFVFGPIIYEDLFLFAKADGYIYAVNLADGTTAWKTKVDTQNLFSFNSSFNNTVQPSSIQIDARNQRLFWSLNVKESAPASNYTGLLCSLSLSNGSVKWLKLLENENASFVGFAFGGINLAFNSETDKIFLTKNNGLWIFDASTSDLIQRQQFDHYILPPIAFGNETYVVGDLWLSAYS